jgi:hypothetical protein
VYDPLEIANEEERERGTILSTLEIIVNKVYDTRKEKEGVKGWLLDLTVPRLSMGGKLPLSFIAVYPEIKTPEKDFLDLLNVGDTKIVGKMLVNCSESLPDMTKKERKAGYKDVNSQKFFEIKYTYDGTSFIPTPLFQGLK